MEMTMRTRLSLSILAVAVGALLASACAERAKLSPSQTSGPHPVIPEPDKGVLHCPCHDGFFDLRSGSPTAGPPQRPLPRITLEIRGRDIYATGVEMRTV